MATPQVLLVDDDTQIREMIETTFQVEGLEILTVSNGEDCLKILEKGFKGVVLVDVMMPEMNGWEVVSEIRKRNLLGGIVICMFTAKGEPDSGMEDVKDCIMDYFHKPIDTQKLITLVRSYLNFVER